MRIKETLGVVILFLFVVSILGCGPSTVRFMEIQLISPEPTDFMTYEDEILKIEFVDLVRQTITFRLENKTESTMRIIWDEVVFVNVDGEALSTIHDKVPGLDKTKTVLPTVIPGGANVTKSIIPTDSLYWTSGTQYTAGGWQVRNIFKLGEGRTMHDYAGERVSVLIPIELDEERIEYRFEFEVGAWVEILKQLACSPPGSPLPGDCLSVSLESDKTDIVVRL